MRGKKAERVLLFLSRVGAALEEPMKKDVAGVAGAARIDQLSMAELTHAERHGKRLDKTSKSRAINNDLPLTTTGLNLKELYHQHIAGAFIPKSRAKAMHVVIQFPKDLVDGEHPALMLRHATAFVESVFGKNSIFGNRVDRDEKSRHVVDLFIAPKYVKKTKHQDKVAVSVSRHQKELAQKYNCPPTPIGTGRALQDALFEYLRDTMRLKNVKRGEPKLIPGPDWKLPEQLRVEELADQKAKADAREQRLDARERGVDALSDDLAARETRINSREREAEQAAAAADADRSAQAVARAEMERALRQAEDDRRAAAVARGEAERSRIEHDVAREAAIAAEHRAKCDAASAEQTRRDAETAYARAIAERDAVSAARVDVDERRKLHAAQLALLARAADDDNGLALSLSGETFTMRQHRMTEPERVANAKPWSPPIVAIARALAVALDRVRDLARRLGLREKAIADQEAAVQKREAEVARERAIQDARRVEHEAAVTLLELQRTALEADEARVAKAAALAAERLVAVTARQTEADAALADNVRWTRVMDALESNPEAIEFAEGGVIRLDRNIASASPELARAFDAKPPAWVVSLAIQRLDLADALAKASEREKEASYAAERLQALIPEAGSILTPAQQAMSEKATRLIHALAPNRDDIGR